MENENYNLNKTEQKPVQQEYSTAPSIEEAQDNEGGGMFKLGSIIVILAIVVFGGFYLWGALADKNNAIKENNSELQFNDTSTGDVQVVEPGSTVDEALKDVKDAVADQLDTQGTSDNINEIEADLNASDLGDVNLDDVGF